MEKPSIIEDRIKMLHEAIRDEQATIFNIDWKARTLRMVNSLGPMSRFCCRVFHRHWSRS